MNDKKNIPDCRKPSLIDEKFKMELPGIIDDIVEDCDNPKCFNHIGLTQIPSVESITEILTLFRDILFPGYFGKRAINRHEVSYHLGTQINSLFEKLSHQITCAIKHECRRYETPCDYCHSKGLSEALELIKKIPALRKKFASDIKAAYDGDPASKSYDEIIFCYPGFHAITIYRIAHELYRNKIPLIPRIMAELAHKVTGIDIHPGARIGDHFFIDHGTGIVIGETCVIGNNVRVYQGVTLGALSFPKDEQGRLRKGIQRHPTIEDNVIIYSGSTILGGETVIGNGAIIGGNAWVTKSVEPGTKVILVTPELKYHKSKPKK